MQHIINQIESMRTKDTMVLAYGSWANASATFRPTGIAPCIGIGLRRRLSKHFLVADTPEHYTSKTCSVCREACGPFHALEAKRRKELTAKAKTPEAKKKAQRHEIRGLRRCQNVECGVILHRDQNGATNIATNFRLIYNGLCPLRSLTTEDMELQSLTNCF